MLHTIHYTDSDNRSYSYEISCLQGVDVLAARSLWEEVFSEDSQAFTDYYFQNKAVLNTTFVCLLDDKIVSMVHLTPYQIMIGGKEVPTYYIVGVATQKEHRHRGLMAALLQEAFDYAKKTDCPFVFLMPANPAIYEPFGFSYVYSRPQYDVPDMLTRKEVYINSFSIPGIVLNCLEGTASAADLQELSDFATRTLQTQFDYYLTRTPAYYELLLKELASQNGCIFTFSLKGHMEGYFLYTKEDDKPFIQELLFSPKLFAYSGNIMSTYFPMEQAEKKPIIMAKNLMLSGLEYELSAASIISVPAADVSAVPAPFASFASCAETDYVNYLLHHKGIINEIV
jgi:predicted N-acetyltransferase YhbS